MSGQSHTNITLLSCGVFQAEVRALGEAHWPDLKLGFMSSKLHMKPENLAIKLTAAVGKELEQGRRVALIYGDCCTAMADLTSRPGVARTRGNNCYDLLLGRDEYRRLAREGAFFLLPEWARRWREIFEKELGLNCENATGLMRDMHQRLIYLDTGLVPVPESDLQACAQYCGLPCEVMPVTLEMLHAAIQEALESFETLGRAK